MTEINRQIGGRVRKALVLADEAADLCVQFSQSLLLSLVEGNRG
jgi:hypothetical protein